MPTHMDHPYSADHDPIARAARQGVSPMVIVVAILMLAAFVWILVR
jgi:hypothetical protein